MLGKVHELRNTNFNNILSPYPLQLYATFQFCFPLCYVTNDSLPPISKLNLKRYTGSYNTTQT